MKNNRSIKLLLALFFILICLVGVAATWTVISLPEMAAETFGSPAGDLSATNRIIYSGRLLYEKPLLVAPLLPGAPEKSFTVSQGEAVNSICFRLEEEGFIKDGDAFRHYLIYRGLDRGIQAGEYLLSPGMTALEIANRIQDSTPTEVTFTILAGWRAEEVAASLPTSGLSITPEQFLMLVQDPSTVNFPEGFPNVSNLEGYLFPGQYRLKRDISVQDLIKTILQRFTDEVISTLKDTLKQRNMTIQDAVILASIVEREAVIDEEQPMIASVFFNRLEAGMKLESDPTAQYAIGYDEQKNTWWKNPLSLNDLKVNSPYNTYGNFGLPPGPISNPGLSALNSVANPATTPYYYFQAACDGSGRHNFAKTFEEHLQNGCQ